MLKEPCLDGLVEGKGEGFYSLCIPLKTPLFGSDEKRVHRISVVFSCLNFAASPVVSLFSKLGVLFIVEKFFVTYFITFFMSRTAESIGAVMVVIDEVAFGSGEFKIRAVLA